MRLLKMIICFLLINLSVLYSRTITFIKNNDFSDKNLTINATDYSKTIKPYPENRVHRTGMFWMNITNSGVLGNSGFGSNNETFTDQCTGKTAPSGDFPGGSEFAYLSSASIWLGGYLDSTEINLSGINSKIFQGPLVSTGYGSLDWGWSNELWPILFDDDPSGLTLGRINETSNVEGRINCLFQDVYDPKATGFEQFTTMFSDKYKSPDNWDPYGRPDHIPLGGEIRKKSYAWP
ncbi:MAG: hypothetical protein PHH55_07040, partial [Candidatus Delongbacteria bacterium]|nr:hypothetical protein [Candidatus Delongbacteria bacterium]